LAGHLTYTGERRCVYRVYREIDHMEDSGVDERIILRWNFRSGLGSWKGIDVAQNRNRWRTAVNTVMHIRAP
jgi:hypothetical protein